MNIYILLVILLLAGFARGQEEETAAFSPEFVESQLATPSFSIVASETTFDCSGGVLTLTIETDSKVRWSLDRQTLLEFSKFEGTGSATVEVKVPLRHLAEELTSTPNYNEFQYYVRYSTNYGHGGTIFLQQYQQGVENRIRLLDKLIKLNQLGGGVTINYERISPCSIVKVDVWEETFFLDGTSSKSLKEEFWGACSEPTLRSNKLQKKCYTIPALPLNKNVASRKYYLEFYDVGWSEIQPIGSPKKKEFLDVAVIEQTIKCSIYTFDKQIIFQPEDTIVWTPLFFSAAELELDKSYCPLELTLDDGGKGLISVGPDTSIRSYVFAYEITAKENMGETYSGTITLKVPGNVQEVIHFTHLGYDDAVSPDHLSDAIEVPSLGGNYYLSTLNTTLEPFENSTNKIADEGSVWLRCKQFPGNAFFGIRLFYGGETADPVFASKNRIDAFYMDQSGSLIPVNENYRSPNNLNFRTGGYKSEYIYVRIMSNNQNRTRYFVEILVAPTFTYPAQFTPVPGNYWFVN